MNNGTSATLSMGYNGNQLTRKGTSAYAYDANGNMTADNSKNISNIQYNILNLPKQVTLSSGGVIGYVYDATGIKRQVTHQGEGVNKTTDYCGNVIYESTIGDSQNGTLSKILTEEGYITLSGTTPTYHYYLKDHLGNNRVVLNQDGTTVEQVNHYYPFGGVFDQTAEVTQPYKFGGKELDRTYGLDLYDYSARYMDGAIGRFTTMDPLAEKYYAISPYAYCAGNPVRYVDPDGKKIYFASNVSSQFKKNFAKSVQHLNKHDAAGMLAKLETSDKIYYIAESINKYSMFNQKSNTIIWASEYGLLTNEGVMLSATSVLNHEVDHALQHDQNPEQQKVDAKLDSTNPYSTKEEERVITGSEQETAKKLGETKNGQVTRKDHGGTLYKMKDPISIEIENEITIRPIR